MSFWTDDTYYFMPLPQPGRTMTQTDEWEHNTRLLTALRFEEKQNGWFPIKVSNFKLGLVVQGNGRYGAPPLFPDEFWDVANTGVTVYFQTMDSFDLVINVKGECVHNRRYEQEEVMDLCEVTGKFDYLGYKVDIDKWRGRTPEEAEVMNAFWIWRDEHAPTYYRPEKDIEDAIREFRLRKAYDSQNV